MSPPRRPHRWIFWSVEHASGPKPRRQSACVGETANSQFEFYNRILNSKSPSLRSENSKERAHALKTAVSRDSNAFKGKMKNGTHYKGCHCKKSSCQKKYCECFAEGVKCGDLCRCLNCKNMPEGQPPREPERPPAATPAAVNPVRLALEIPVLLPPLPPPSADPRVCARLSRRSSRRCRAARPGR